MGEGEEGGLAVREGGTRHWEKGWEKEWRGREEGCLAEGLYRSAEREVVVRATEVKEGAKRDSRRSLQVMIWRAQ